MAEGGGITRLPSGFAEDFLNAVEEDLQCSICHLPLKEPVLTRCGHRFCKECLEEHFRRLEDSGQHCNCPTDRIDLDPAQDVFPDKATERKIFSFAIKCSSEGCEWTGELRNKEGHLVSCSYVHVPCTNQNCDVTVQRRNLQQHITSRCQWRIIQCKYCSETRPNCRMRNHIREQCAKFPVPCPSNCGRSIPREKISNHTTNDCPLSLISCPYERIGCKRKIQLLWVFSHDPFSVPSDTPAETILCNNKDRDPTFAPYCALFICRNEIFPVKPRDPCANCSAKNRMI